MVLKVLHLAIALFIIYCIFGPVMIVGIVQNTGSFLHLQIHYTLYDNFLLFFLMNVGSPRIMNNPRVSAVLKCSLSINIQIVAGIDTYILKTRGFGEEFIFFTSFSILLPFVLFALLMTITHFCSSTGSEESAQSAESTPNYGTTTSVPVVHPDGHPAIAIPSIPSLPHTESCR